VFDTEIIGSTFSRRQMSFSARNSRKSSRSSLRASSRNLSCGAGKHHLDSWILQFGRDVKEGRGSRRTDSTHAVAGGAREETRESRSRTRADSSTVSRVLAIDERIQSEEYLQLVRRASRVWNERQRKRSDVTGATSWRTPPARESAQLTLHVCSWTGEIYLISR
jgi:hypothetical protein